MLSVACKITREANTLTMLVKADTRDDEVLERAFERKRPIELEHSGQLLTVRILACELKGRLVEWRGEIIPAPASSRKATQ